MTKRFLLKSSAELLHAILSGTRPADKYMEIYFRAHKQMGVRDRGFVAETVYGCLRRKRLLEHICNNDNPSAEDIVTSYLLMEGLSARALEALGYQADAITLTARVRQINIDALPFAIRMNLPDELAQRLLAEFGPEEAVALISSLNQPAPVDLRVNTLKAKREEVQRLLAEEGYVTEPIALSPFGLRRQDRAPLFRTRTFKQGLFEMQDAGSQLLTLLLEPRRGEMVVDFCAGAGGKTLQLGALMANTGTVYAFDVSLKRLERLKPRVRRAGLNNIRTVSIAHERDARVQRLHGKIDRVLVDAPCSGTGTLRRNPDIKWRALDLTELANTQKRILAAAANLVKLGGRLVYATCSILREENETIIEHFLQTHDGFERISPTEILARRKIPITTQSDALRLYPHVHQTDGFYAAILERRR